MLLFGGSFVENFGTACQVEDCVECMVCFCSKHSAADISALIILEHVWQILNIYTPLDAIQFPCIELYCWSLYFQGALSACQLTSYSTASLIYSLNYSSSSEPDYCLSVGLYVCLSQALHPNFSKFSVHVTYGHVSVLCQHCNTLYGILFCGRCHVCT